MDRLVLNIRPHSEWAITECIKPGVYKPRAPVTVVTTICTGAPNIVVPDSGTYFKSLLSYLQFWGGSWVSETSVHPYINHTLGKEDSWNTIYSLSFYGTRYILYPPPSWGFDVPLATALCKPFLLRMLNNSWAGRNPPKGCSADWRRRRSYILYKI
jgi:hypothetical protein